VYWDAKKQSSIKYITIDFRKNEIKYKYYINLKICKIIKKTNKYNYL